MEQKKNPPQHTLIKILNIQNKERKLDCPKAQTFAFWVTHHFPRDLISLILRNAHIDILGQAFTLT